MSESNKSESSPIIDIWEAVGNARVKYSSLGLTEEEAMITALTEEIQTALAGRLLPIQIKHGEVITDIDTFARSQAQAVITGSKHVAEPALERLWQLGIKLGPAPAK